MNWIPLTNEAQLAQVDEWSTTEPVLLFKHSTRCSISSTALKRLENQWQEIGIKAVFLDLLSYRQLSNAIASKYKIEHQSPQALVIKNGKCIYHESHMAINFADLYDAVKA